MRMRRCTYKSTGWRLANSFFSNLIICFEIHVAVGLRISLIVSEAGVYRLRCELEFLSVRAHKSRELVRNTSFVPYTGLTLIF